VKKRPGARRARSWHERLAAALTDVALDLVKQTRGR
jgi:hypothetical protein